MKLIDLKLPKRSIEELKTSAPLNEEGPRYPYGFRLTFEADEVEKLPGLEKMKIGEKVKVEGLGEVTSIRMNEVKDQKKRYSVEIQLQKIGVASTENYEESFKEVSKSSMEKVAKDTIGDT